MQDIILIRHGESQSNTQEVTPQDMGDFRIPLTARGVAQAFSLGQQRGAALFDNALVYCSPYLRTRQTLRHICRGAGVVPAELGILEDPRLREMEPGFGVYREQLARRREFGWFYYRSDAGGESVADVYDRCSSFFTSMWRQLERSDAQRIVIVAHGMTIRAFIMRFFHLSVEDFCQMINPDNCDVLRIGTKASVENPLYQSARWAMGHDLTLREREADAWQW